MTGIIVFLFTCLFLFYNNNNNNVLCSNDYYNDSRSDYPKDNFECYSSKAYEDIKNEITTIGCSEYQDAVEVIKKKFKNESFYNCLPIDKHKCNKVSYPTRPINDIVNINNISLSDILIFFIGYEIRYYYYLLLLLLILVIFIIIITIML